MIRALTFLATLLAASAAWAHSASTSYIVAKAAGHDVDVQWSLALRDLDDAIGLDRDGAGLLTWGMVRTNADRIDAYALARLRMSSAGAGCVPSGEVAHLIDDLGDGAYAVLRYRLRCPVAIDRLDIAYSALFEADPQHRGLLNLDIGGATQAAVLSPTAGTVAFGPAPGPGTLAREFFVSGMEHLLGGPDHLLFIVMLLAPALLRPAAPGTRGSATARAIEVVGVLSAFTASHALALTLAVLGLVTVPASIAEPAIALTILVTAIDNLRPFLPGKRWTLALGFGLVHGLSIAGGLGPLILPPLVLALALLSFNLGLEAVQIAIAVATAPLGYVLRATPDISWRLLPMLSASAAVIATLWICQRAERPFAAMTASASQAATLTPEAHP